VSSLILLGETPITAASAYVFLGEPVTWLMVVGGAIALGSLGMIVWRATRAGAGQHAAEAGVTGGY
jgi:drug/metabolite transporter (DMT)-like permease